PEPQAQSRRRLRRIPPRSSGRSRSRTRWFQKSTTGVSATYCSNNTQNGVVWEAAYQLSNSAKDLMTSAFGVSLSGASSLSGARLANTAAATGAKCDDTALRASLSLLQPCFARNIARL